MSPEPPAVVDGAADGSLILMSCLSGVVATLPDEPARPVLRYHGAKWRLAPWIIGHFPGHDRYVEPYGGSAAVLLRKPRSGGEVYNDLDEQVVNVFRVLQDPALAERLHALRGLVLLSGYPSPLYVKLYAGWDFVDTRARTDSGDARVERLWFNPACVRAQRQLSFHLKPR